jgi:hypothetical protein
MPQGDFEETRAVAHLPNLQIEIIHGRSPVGDAERLSINMLAVPSFGAFRNYVEIANPFILWMRFVRTAWVPWLSAAPAISPWSALREGPVSGHIAPPEASTAGKSSKIAQ